MNGENNFKQRIIQESVPGRQITLAHIIANPDKSLFEILGFEPAEGGAIGVMTICPAETSIIMADIAIKASGVRVGFADMQSGSLFITGSVSEVEAATLAILDYLSEKLGFSVCPISNT
ncbi:MAG: BMC domain-containing protein [Clostridiales bacterium]|jgi:ethanolamine utilization protein EutS|nr:BMC domain-containing protein [Clostridiales bacterium]